MTVKLSVMHELPCTPAQFWEIYWDVGFQQKLAEVARLKEYTVVSDEDSVTCRIASVFISPQREFPSVVRRMVKNATAAFVEDRRWVKAESCVYWNVRPQALEGRANCKGTLRVTATATGCERLIEGVVTVRLMGVGSLIERLIATNVSESMNASAQLIADWQKGAL